MPDDTFPPTIQENGTIKAGGLVLGRLDADRACLVLRDRYRTRALNRGTPDVPIDLVELLELLIDHLRSQEAQPL